MFELIRRIRIEGEHATGTAEIAADEPALADHFPGRPLVPGTWLVELAAQIAGPLAEEVTRARHGLDRWALLAMIDHAKLLAPVELPASLALDATITRSEPSTVTARVLARCGELVVVRADLVFALIEAPPGSAPAIAARHARLARWKAAP